MKVVRQVPKPQFAQRLTLIHCSDHLSEQIKVFWSLYHHWKDLQLFCRWLFRAKYFCMVLSRAEQIIQTRGAVALHFFPQKGCKYHSSHIQQMISTTFWTEQKDVGWYLVGRTQAENITKICVWISTKKQWHFSAFSAYHKKFLFCAETKELKFKDPSTDRTLLNFTLMEELKLRVMENVNLTNEMYRN